MEWSRATDGLMGGPFENALELMIVVFIPPMQLLRFPRAQQLSVHVAVLCTVMGLQRQAAIGPQLPFANSVNDLETPKFAGESGMTFRRPPFLLGRSGAERPGAVKSAFFAAKRTLDGEDRSARIPREGMARFLGAPRRGAFL